MKKILVKLFVLIVLTIFTSCSTSDKVAQHSRIQKRKYNSGYHISFFNTSKFEKVESVENEVLSTDVAINNIKGSDNSVSTEVPVKNSNETNTEVNVFETKNYQIDTLFSTKLSKKYVYPNLQKNKAVRILKNNDIKEVAFSKKEIKNIINSQKSGKIDDEKLLFILLLILAFILPPLAVLLYTNIDWKKVIIALLLTCLWWGPGVIYAILVLLDIL